MYNAKELLFVRCLGGKWKPLLCERKMSRRLTPFTSCVAIRSEIRDSSEGWHFAAGFLSSGFSKIWILVLWIAWLTLSLSRLLRPYSNYIRKVVSEWKYHWMFACFHTTTVPKYNSVTMYALSASLFSFVCQKVGIKTQ